MTQNAAEPGARVPRPRPSGAIRRRDRMLLIGLAVAVVSFSAISIAVNALRPDVPTTSSSEVVDPRAQDSDFVVHLGMIDVPGMDQKQYIALGRATCTALASGATEQQATAQLTAQGLTQAQANGVLAAAIAAYCPERR